MADQSGNEILLDMALRRAVLAERFKAHEVRRIVRVLDKEVLPDLIARLAGRLANIRARGFDVGPESTSRLAFLYRDLRGLFDDMVKRFVSETKTPLTHLASMEARATAKSVVDLVRGQASFSTPSESTIRSVALDRPFDGATIKERWATRGEKMRANVERQVRIGIFQSETSEQIVGRVRDLWPTERAHVAGLVRTAVSHAHAQARQAVFEENSDLIKSVMWVATLDLQTCPRCGALDGETFPIDSGPRPPLHLGPCRCTVTPVVRKIPGITRASMDGQVPAKVRFADWISRQSAERQDEAFGPARARLFRAGKIGLEDMADASGHLLTLDELRNALA